MKKLLLLLFSLFLLSSPSVFAEDISDFQIEGISIGDSLLDYMTEDEILDEIELNKDYYYYLKEPNKYAEVYLFNYSSTYEAGLSFLIKNNVADLYIAETDEKYTIPGIRESNQYITDKNEEYTILLVRGMKNYIEDFDSCIQKKDEVAEELSNKFPNAQIIEQNFAHPIDPSGDSITNNTYFVFDSGAEVHAKCVDFEETLRLKNHWSEGLDIVIQSEEVTRWMSDY